MKQVSARFAQVSALLTLLLAVLVANAVAAADPPGGRAPPAWQLRLDAGPGATVVERQVLADAADERGHDSPGDGEAVAPSPPRGDAPHSGRSRPPSSSSDAAPWVPRHAFHARAPPAS